MYSSSMGKEISKGKFLHKCNRCDNQWISKIKNPKTCPNKTCRSPYWNKKRVRK